MKRLNSLTLALLLGALPPLSWAQPPGDSWLQLHRLNQTNRQELERMQRTHTEQRRPAEPVAQQAWEQLQRQQRLEQQALQQSQQRQRLIMEQHRRVLPSTRAQRLQGLFQQQRFRQAQEFQLQRFELQQRSYPRPP